MTIEKQYRRREKQTDSDVLLDIKTYEDIKEALEDAVLAAMMIETSDESPQRVSSFPIKV